MKTKTSILTLIKAFFILLVSGSVLSCNLEVKKEEKPKFKYIITHHEGFKKIREYSLSEIEYLSNGCAKFLGFSYGKIDTTVICGTFVVEHYR
jgi:hypothetical protein